MIRNIIFDLGNVLVSFKPSEYFTKENYPENIKATILTDIFESNQWIMLDKGEISLTEAIDAIASVSSLKKEEIAHVFNLRTSLMFPLDQNVKILSGLKKQGFRLYYLSNFPKDVFDEIKSGYYFFKYFDGGIISSDVHITKPHPRIYEIILEKYDLIAEECLFIDDLEPNIKAAELLGMNGLITFGSGEISGALAEALNMHNK
jgi:epoxide hydrolase-like predicted phosphatase